MQTKEQRALTVHDYYIANKETLDKKHREWLMEHRAEVRKYNRDRYRVFKREVLDHYGGAICIDCMATDMTLLTLDHVNEDGGEHRRRLFGPDANGSGCGLGASGDKFYRLLRKLGYPNDPPLAVRCRKCNWAKQEAYMKRQQEINGVNVWIDPPTNFEKSNRAYRIKSKFREDQDG